VTSSHWESVHAEKGTDVSWWQDTEDLWLDVIDGLTLDPTAPIVDIGSGSSPWVDAMCAQGFTDVTAVDVSAAALERIRRRAGGRVHLVVADARDFTPAAPVGLWHDRAVFHFLVEAEDRERYRETLRTWLRPDGYAVVATFAPDGPESCSGLPVQRYDAAGLAQALGLQLVSAGRRIHHTPWGTQQPFTVVVLQP
jgi:SAM-dependent methyltransferase